MARGDSFGCLGLVQGLCCCLVDGLCGLVDGLEALLLPRPRPGGFPATNPRYPSSSSSQVWRREAGISSGPPPPVTRATNSSSSSSQVWRTGTPRDVGISSGPPAPVPRATNPSSSSSQVRRTESPRDVRIDSGPRPRPPVPPVARNPPSQQPDEDDDDDCVIVGQKGEVACRDFPHSRHLCSNMPFSTTSHEKHCTMCYCFVCDAPAPCGYWGKGLSVGDHCHATDKEDRWRTLREVFRLANLPASHTEEGTVMYPAITSLARLFLGNQIPLQNAVSQNQNALTSVRASLNVAPTVNAPREGNGTSNAQSAQISHPLAPTVSAPRAHPAAGAGRGTINTHTAQISHPLALSAPGASSATRVQSSTSNGQSGRVTHLVEPTVNAPRPHLAAGAGKGTSNDHTAQISHPPAPTVGAPRAYHAAGAGRGTSNGHTAPTTHPVNAARTGRGRGNTRTSQITQPIEQTVSAIRAYPSGRTGRGISNAHTAQSTCPMEQTVSAPGVYPAARARIDSSNARSGQITYPTTTNGELDAPEEATVHVQNLPYRIDNEKLKLSFQHAGVILFSKASLLALHYPCPHNYM